MATKFIFYKYFPLLLVKFFLFNYALALSSNIQKAIQAFDQGDLATAQAIIDEVVVDAKYQSQANSWYYRAVVYDQLMRNHITLDSASAYRNEAIQSYQKTLTLSKKKSQYHSFAQINLQALWTYYINRGVQYYKMEVFEEALEQFAIAQKIAPLLPLTTLYTAITNQQIEQYEQALREYKECQAQGYQDPIKDRALANLTFHYLNDSKKAQDILEKAIQQDPWNINLLEDYYQLLSTSRQLADKQRHLQSQLLTTLDKPAYYYQLAYLYDKINQYDQATESYEKALVLAPRQVEIIIQLAALHYKYAAEVLSSIMGLPEEEFQHTGQALIEQFHQYLQNSVTYWEKAYRLSPKNLYILQQLCSLYKWLNNEKKHKAMIQQVKKVGGSTKLVNVE